MQDQPNLSPAQEELEHALRSLPAPPARLDPVAAAFAAGRRSSRRTLRAWQSVAALFIITTLVAPMLRPQVPPPAIAGQGSGSVAMEERRSAPPEISPQSLMVLDQTVRTEGLDALPRLTPPAVAPTRLQHSPL